MMDENNPNQPQQDGENRPGENMPENNGAQLTQGFTSALTRGEAIADMVYLPMHLAGIPILCTLVFAWGWVNQSQANFLCYAIGVVYMLIFLRHFLRREFDPLCDKPLKCLAEIGLNYGAMLCFNMGVSMLLVLLNFSENPNNSSITETASMEYGPMAAAAIFLAPIVEELLFRAGIFGLIRRKNRILAYAVSALVFALYHVWQYAVAVDPIYLIYLLQYIPAGILLCRCYERTNSIWSSILMHILTNAVAFKALETLEQL